MDDEADSDDGYATFLEGESLIAKYLHHYADKLMDMERVVQFSSIVRAVLVPNVKYLLFGEMRF